MQVAPASHWPEMQILVFVVNAAKKAVSSSSGMQTSVKTSALIKHRADVVVPQRMRDIEAAILAKDFDTFGRYRVWTLNNRREALGFWIWGRQGQSCKVAKLISAPYCVW